ncbi:stalk domain-containing protein [Paenibacillus polysaccharolyticus]|uniref:stalk domain-containing protein n=1 Tax=Paenibacillus polysaccharolyticus TaxID=582692 RepID=UPI00203A9ADD|nr:stalk domain-containing protein [Paenibacillus polysaccharolyticus]MCM3132199.1 stalk domain-containing protein [Paenibacillus polysaccharolyticus]
MMKTSKSKKMIAAAVLMMSLTFSGLASASATEMKMIKKDGMELVQLRQAAKMYGYSIMWDSKDRSVTLMYMDNMHDKMMEDDMKMKNDMMMKDDMMMEGAMMPAAKTIKVWVGSTKMMVDGMQVSLKSMPMIHEGNTYVTDMVISKYMMPMKAMK